MAFGFMDNVIMIQAGGYIDATFGATLGLATLSAAALGQVVSDVSGVVFGSTVEGLLVKYQLMPQSSVPLTTVQRQLPNVRRVAMMGSVAGMVVGCLLGASSLLFVDLKAHERQKRTAELKDVITTMLLQQQQDDGNGNGNGNADADAGSLEEGGSSSNTNNNNNNNNNNNTCHVHLTNNKAFAMDVHATSSSNTNNNAAPVQFSFISHKDDPTVARCARDQVPTLQDDSFYVPIRGTGATTWGVLEFQQDGLSLSQEDQQTAVIVARHVAIFMERLARD